MDLVNKENIPGVQVGQQRRQISGLFNGRAGGDADIDPHLVGDDPRQGGFAQTGRAVKERVIQRLIPPAGGFNVDGQIALGLFLAGVIGKELRPQTDFPRVLGREGGGHNGSVQLLGEFKAHSVPPVMIAGAGRREMGDVRYKI